MNEKRISFLSISVKTIVVHTVTYFFMGLLAFQILDYETRFADPHFGNFMRQTSDVIVMMGPVFQPIRGFLFGIVFFLLRDVLFKRKNGWLIMWVMLFILGILSTFGPAPGSVEGLIYTIIPVSMQIIPLSEIILQAFLLSVVLCCWVNHPNKKWISIVFGILFFIVIILPIMGLIMT
ncbi:hypothetical protein JW824_03560 [bacterium]|nr:hypothetical protein [bacterium]